MRPELPAPVPAVGWTALDPSRIGLGWAAPVAPGLVGAFEPPAGEEAPAPVVDLAARRAAAPARARLRRVPDADVLVIFRAPAPRPADPPVREDVLDLAEIAPAPIPFPGPRRLTSTDRHRIILYVVGAAFILAAGMVHTFKTARFARGIAVPDTVTPGHVVT